MVYLLCDLELWLWPWILKVKFRKISIIGIRGWIDIKWCESIGCWTQVVTLNFYLTHDLDLEFSRSNFWYPYFRNGKVDWLGMKEMWVGYSVTMGFLLAHSAWQIDQYPTSWSINGLFVHWSRGWGVLSFSERLVLSSCLNIILHFELFMLLIEKKLCRLAKFSLQIFHYFNWSVWEIEYPDANFVINTLRQRQNWHNFADDIFKCIFLNENIWISLNISQKYVPKVWINNIPALVQIMAWCRPGNKPLSEQMMGQHICVLQPEWVSYKQ